MDQEILIWGVAVAVIAMFAAAHGWLHKLLKFKMDESSILALFESTEQSHTSEAIATHTDIPVERVEHTCIKSPKIQQDSYKKQSWCLQKHARQLKG